MAQVELVVPPEPEIKPGSPNLSQIDTNRDFIDDEIERVIDAAQATLASPTASPEERSNAQATLDEVVTVEFNFTRQITQAELDDFVQVGGQVTYIYKAVAYGWNATLPRKVIHDAVSRMQAGFNGVILAQPVVAMLHTASRVGRVRQQWNLGYDGDPNITVAIIDSGVSESHTDLNGRRVYWKDTSTDQTTAPVDKYEHGTHVAGIALGTGAASGANPNTINYTDSIWWPPVGTFWPRFLTEVPTPNGGSGAANFRWNATMNWGPIGGARSAGLYFGLYEESNDPATEVNDVNYFALTSEISSTSSPITANSDANQPNGIASPYVWTGPQGENINTSLFQNFARPLSGTGWEAGAYSIAATLTALNNHNFGIGDAFNLERGVAPACSWAGFKVATHGGDANTTTMGAGLDDLCAVRTTYNIKVANMSYGLPFGVTDVALRQKAVNLKISYSA